MACRIFSGAQVRALLPMPDCIAAMEAAMRTVSAKPVRVPPRLVMPPVDEFSGLNDCEFVVTADVAEATRCDVVGVVTGASETVIQGCDVSLGVPVKLVGAHSATAREADTALVGL